MTGSYDDAEGLRRAFDGTRTLLMVSASEAPDRQRLHANVVDAAVAAGVERIVYTSFFGAAPDCTFTFGRDHWHAEEHIRASGLGHTFLRDNLYIDFTPLLVGADGVIRDRPPAGGWRGGWPSAGRPSGWWCATRPGRRRWPGRRS